MTNTDDDSFEFPARTKKKDAEKSIGKLNMNYAAINKIIPLVLNEESLKPSTEMLVKTIKELNQEIGFDIAKLNSYFTNGTD
jgi:hypothetical protein